MSADREDELMTIIMIMQSLWKQQMMMIFYRRITLSQPIYAALITSNTFSSAFKQPCCNYSGIESSKAMQKLLNKRGGKTKRKWYQAHIAEPMELSGRQQRLTKKGVSESQGHRARQLGHVLYAKICQVVNSGELSEELLNKHVFLTKVKMHPTFGGMNVYWDAKRSDASEIEELLLPLSGKLRSILISYHVLGKIPKITFVKDRSGGDLARLNQLFEIADYGPDYIPSGSGDNQLFSRMHNEEAISSMPHRWQSADSRGDGDTSVLNFTANSALEATDGDERISDLSDDAGWYNKEREVLGHTSSAGKETGQTLTFPSNMYGLPRDVLMNKVLAKKTKSKFQSSGDATLDSLNVLSDIKDYSQLKIKSKTKEKMLHLRESTKVKQRLLEQEFYDVHDSLTAESEVDKHLYSDYNDFSDEDERTLK